MQHIQMYFTMRFCKESILMKLGLATSPGAPRPLFTNSVWVFLRLPGFCVNSEGCEMGPTVYCPYPRRLESLTICGCNYKGSTFS